MISRIVYDHVLEDYELVDWIAIGMLSIIFFIGWLVYFVTFIGLAYRMIFIEFGLIDVLLKERTW